MQQLRLSHVVCCGHHKIIVQQENRDFHHHNETKAKCDVLGGVGFGQYRILTEWLFRNCYSIIIEHMIDSPWRNSKQIINRSDLSFSIGWFISWQNSTLIALLILFIFDLYVDAWSRITCSLFDLFFSGLLYFFSIWLKIWNSTHHTSVSNHYTQDKYYVTNKASISTTAFSTYFYPSGMLHLIGFWNLYLYDNYVLNSDYPLFWWKSSLGKLCNYLICNCIELNRHFFDCNHRIQWNKRDCTVIFLN